MDNKLFEIKDPAIFKCCRKILRNIRSTKRFLLNANDIGIVAGFILFCEVKTSRCRCIDVTIRNQSIKMSWRHTGHQLRWPVQTCLALWLAVSFYSCDLIGWRCSLLLEITFLGNFVSQFMTLFNPLFIYLFSDGEHEFLDFNEKLSKLAKFAPHLWKDDVSFDTLCRIKTFLHRIQEILKLTLSLCQVRERFQ